MDAVLGKPYRKTSVAVVEAAATDIFTAQKRSDFGLRLLFHILSGDAHTAVVVVAAKPENGVNLFLGKRKSEGRICYTLRFVYKCYLFVFREEKAYLLTGSRGFKGI